MGIFSAEAANRHVRVVLRSAPPLTLHSEEFWRTDGNSPGLIESGRTTVFFFDYEPRGHTLRRRDDGNRSCS
jgi:hypothetical protein